MNVNSGLQTLLLLVAVVIVAGALAHLLQEFLGIPLTEAAIDGAAITLAMLALALHIRH